MRITTAQIKGPRPYQEDRFTTVSDKWGTILAVFDGHGGSEAADKAEEVLLLYTKMRDDVLENFNEATMQTLFQELNFYTCDMDAGSTASIVFISPDKTKAIVGILGDSPVYIIDNDWKLNVSPEHNVRSNEAERLSAEKRGGTISNGYLYDFSWNGGMYTSIRYDIKGLQMSRALGDKALSKVLNREPEIYTVQLGPDSTVVVSSDGILDPAHTFIGVNQRLECLKFAFYRGEPADTILKQTEQEYNFQDNATLIVANIGINEQ